MFALIIHHLVSLTTESVRTKRMNRFSQKCVVLISRNAFLKKHTQNQDTIVISEFEETQEEERSGKATRSFFQKCATLSNHVDILLPHRLEQHPMKDQKMHFKCFVERSMRKTKFSQMARTTFLMFRQGMKPRCLSCGQTLKIFIVKTSPLDITTSETLKLTVRLRI